MCRRCPPSCAPRAPRAFGGSPELTMVGRRVALHGGAHGVSIVGRDVVALAVDVEKHVHLFGQRVLRRFHVRVTEARVMRVWMLPVEHGRVVVADPAWLVRRHLHGPGGAGTVRRAGRRRRKAPGRCRCSLQPRQGVGRGKVCLQCRQTETHWRARR